MNLKTYIEDRIVQLDLNEEQTIEVLGTKTRYTRLTNRPERATLVDVLRLADRLECHPTFLIKEFGMGALMVTDEDKRQLRRHYRVSPKPDMHDKPQNNANQATTYEAA